MKSIVLKSGGLFVKSWDKLLQDYVMTELAVTCESLMRHRASQFSVDGEVTLRDFVKYLASLRSDEIDKIEKFTNSNIESHLHETMKHIEDAPKEDETRLTAIEVYKGIDLDNFATGTDVYEMMISTSAHGVGAPWDTNPLNRNCNTYAIEFTPWRDMLHLPIKLNPLVYYSMMNWKVVPPKKIVFDVVGKKGEKVDEMDFGFSDREVDKRETDPLKITANFTFEEFLNGLFNELSFFSSPVSRDSEIEVMKERINEIDDLDS